MQRNTRPEGSGRHSAKIAKGGFDVFYKGEIAKAIVDYVQAHGGVFTMEDMANYDVAWREPYRTTLSCAKTQPF